MLAKTPPYTEINTVPSLEGEKIPKTIHWLLAHFKYISHEYYLRV